MLQKQTILLISTFFALCFISGCKKTDSHPIGASSDWKVSLGDKFSSQYSQNGRELWKYKLPAGGYATPSVYAVNGKQYVVIAAGGGKMGTAPGDYYIAFSLNEE